MSSNDNIELENLGGRVNVIEGQLIFEADLNRMGSLAQQSICNMLALLFYDEHNGRPLSGFPRLADETNHCRVVGTVGLGFEVQPGFGMLFDASAGPDTWGPGSYRPICLDTAFTGTLDPHSPLPRIDVVAIAPEMEFDEVTVVHVKDPADGSFDAPTSPRRARFGAKVTVVKGHPDVPPRPPAVPAGYIKLAEGLVPAGVGAVTWKDCRSILQVGSLLGPARFLHAPFVPSGPEARADELEVLPLSPPLRAVEIKPGRAVIGGVCRYSEGDDVYVLGPADPALDRIDVLYITHDGMLGVEEGTPSPLPVAPPAPEGVLELAHIRVRAGGSGVEASDIKDVRRRVPVTGAMLESGTITNDHLVDRTIATEKLATIDTTKLHVEPATRWKTYHGAGFVPSGGSNLDLHADGTSLCYPGSSTGSATDTFYAACPVNLPQGAAVRGLVMYCTPGGSGAVLKVELLREELATGARSVVAEVEFSSGSTSRRAIATTLPGAVPSVNNEQYAYYLRTHIGATVEGFDVNLHAVRIAYSTGDVLSG